MAARTENSPRSSHTPGRDTRWAAPQRLRFTALTLRNARRVCILRRMPRMQVYLPDSLYRAVKERGLPASELLQEAVQAELRRQELNAAADTYLAELIAEVGKPSP